MPIANKPRAKGARRPTKRSCANDVWARTQLLVEVLLEVMEQEMRAGEVERSERWLKLFGPKDSAVVNLQKLVQLMAALQGQPPTTNALDPMVEPVNDEELSILIDWVRNDKASAASASPVAE